MSCNHSNQPVDLLIGASWHRRRWHDLPDIRRRDLREGDSPSTRLRNRH